MAERESLAACTAVPLRDQNTFLAFTSYSGPSIRLWGAQGLLALESWLGAELPQSTFPLEGSSGTIRQVGLGNSAFWPRGCWSPW